MTAFVPPIQYVFILSFITYAYKNNCLDFRWHLQFVQSEFRGQLPKQFAPGSEATRRKPSHMNDMNKEEPSRYVRRNK